MGYRSFFRAVEAANNRAIKVRQRNIKRQNREIARLSKKAEKITEKNDKIIDALEDVYAKGQIDRDEYEKLKKRQDDIDLELIVIGKTPGISLAKRYITGKIDKDEFEQIKKDILPQDLFAEKDRIALDFKNTTQAIKDFKDKCQSAPDNCHFCGKKKSLFSGLKEDQGLLLCKKCQAQFALLKNYKGFTGKYYYTDPRTITIADTEDKINIELNLNKSLF